MRQCLWNARNRPHAADFLTEATQHRMPLDQKQTSNYLSCFLWGAQRPTTHGDDPDSSGRSCIVLRKFIPVSQQMRILISWTENSMFWFKFIFLWLLCFLCFFFLKINIKYGLLNGNAEDWVAVVVGRLRGDSCEYKKHLEGLRCGGCLHRLLDFAANQWLREFNRAGLYLSCRCSWLLVWYRSYLMNLLWVSLSVFQYVFLSCIGLKSLRILYKWSLAINRIWRDQWE